METLVSEIYFRWSQIYLNQKYLQYFAGKQGPDPKLEANGNNSLNRLWKKQHKVQL